MRKLVSVVVLIAATAVGCGTATTPPVPSSVGQVQQAPRPHYEEDDPQWNCQLDGDHKCGHVPACWTEHKRDLPDERLCGFADGAAPDSDGFVFGDFMHDTNIR